MRYRTSDGLIHAWIGWARQKGYPGERGKNLLEKLQPFARKIGMERSQSGNVSARPREARALSTATLPEGSIRARSGFKFMWGLRGSFPVEIEAHILPSRVIPLRLRPTSASAIPPWLPRSTRRMQT
jgi:hypothetical protein